LKTLFAFVRLQDGYAVLLFVGHTLGWNSVRITTSAITTALVFSIPKVAWQEKDVPNSIAGVKAKKVANSKCAR
jgi:hypothetical protein